MRQKHEAEDLFFGKSNFGDKSRESTRNENIWNENSPQNKNPRKKRIM